jgi:ABC-type branched-subunit amino acid transport system substrate-binding protein
VVDSTQWTSQAQGEDEIGRPTRTRCAMRSRSLDEQSFFGPIKFNERGQNVTKPMSAIQIQNGEVVTVYPKDQAEKPLQWPAKVASAGSTNRP